MKQDEKKYKRSPISPYHQMLALSLLSAHYRSVTPSFSPNGVRFRVWFWAFTDPELNRGKKPTYCWSKMPILNCK